VAAVNYDGVCIRNVPNPLVFSAYYTKGVTGNLIPNYSDVHVHNTHSITPGAELFQGYDAAHPLVVQLDNVIVDGQDPAQIQSSDTQFTLGPGPVNFANALSGPDVTVNNQISQSTPPVDCSRAFVPIVFAARMCDANLDGHIDLTDIQAIMNARGTQVGFNDPRDPDGDGVVTMTDARSCVQQCDKAQCAP
jgi:hypothetical protein